MFSSDDEQQQDDTNVFDQLKSIKPFTIEQLYLLHPDVGKPPTTSLSETLNNLDNEPSATNNKHHHHHYQQQQLVQTGEIYLTLIEYEKLKRKLSELRGDIKKLHKKTFDHVDKSWTFKEEATRKIGMCQAGKIAETTFKYNQAVFNLKHLDSFALGFSQLNETITKDYIYYSFESQIKRNKVATQFAIAYQTNDLDKREAKLESAISTLTEFLGHLSESKCDLVVQCRKWLRALAGRFLENGRTENFRYIVSQIAKGPAGTADWMADLIECKPYDQVTGFDSAPQYITHCSALLSELFYTLKSRIKQATNSNATHDNQEDDSKTSEQNWSLIDPRFNCSEDLNVNATSSNLLSESDVIKLCLKISLPQIFKSYVGKCLKSDDEFHLETDKNYEYLMLKLLTIGTIIIKTYQIGLETFNSIQYGNLIEYLSSQIRCTVIILSDQWTEFKTRLRGLDDALLMRLQVEYDNFILRSILIILELRESGIWRNLSLIERDANQDDATPAGWTTDSIRPALVKLLQVTGLSSPEPNTVTPTPASQSPGQTPTRQRKKSKAQISPASSLTYEFSIEWFKEVSEPMLWHILWQFYHNAFVSSCDYHSDNHWVEKFQEKSVEYLFINKIIDSPPGECSYLLNSITSMLLSRTRSDSKLIDFIATEIFNLSYKHPELSDKITVKGTKSLRRCAEKFPRLISVYISLIDSEELDEHVVELLKSCSLKGWMCNSEEMDLLASWLVEFPLESIQNKVARLIISKLLLNNPEIRGTAQLVDEDAINTINTSVFSTRSTKSTSRKFDTFVDLKLRRRLALLLYEASQHHLPEPNDYSQQSLGASVEVAFGSLYCERNAAAQYNLLDLAIDTNYQQFYVWAWRLLFSLNLHILNQPETDWNDVQSRSGSSRSVKNTVLIADSFHPVPTIQDSECMSLSNGLKKQDPMASYIYLLLTDATWQSESLESCLVSLNVLADSGHLTPSLMAVQFLTICHLNDLSENPVKYKQIIDYFTTILTSSWSDATRLASLISTQMSNLKQFRQLQLSQFYTNVFLEVSNDVAKQISSSWLSSNSSELCLEKIACLLDYIVKFNFPTQRLEIIQKFYDSSYLMRDANNCGSKTGWFGSFFTSNSLSASSTRREFLTNLHALTKNFKKCTWLRWVTTECDALRLEKIWEDIVVFMSSNEEANLDDAIKKVCPQVDAAVLKSTLPIYSWIKQIFDIMETDVNHPICPLIWYNFFLNYFSNSLNGVSVGYKLLTQETINKLMSRLDSLFTYHLYKHRNWASASGMQQNSLAQLYRSYKLWLQNSSLREAYVDMDRLKEDYSVPLLKEVMGSSTEGACLQYIDIQTVETQNRNLIQVWTTATNLQMINQLGNELICIDSRADKSMEILAATPAANYENHEASDAVSLIVKSYKDSTAAAGTGSPTMNHKSLDSSGVDELSKPLRAEYITLQADLPEKSFDDIMALIKRNFHQVFDESTLFGFNLLELDKNKSEIIELVKQLYTNKKREFVRVVPCIEGDDCPGPAKIKLEAEEAIIDERKSQCIQDRRRQCQELLGELLLMPRNRTVQSTIIIEELTRQLIEGMGQSKMIIETLLNWISEPDTYKQLNGSFYAANQLLKTVLEILSNTPEVDTYNTALINVCLQHPNSVQIFSPHLSPAACSDECFLELYKTISSKQAQLGTMTTFVLLSKFDINSWLNNINNNNNNTNQRHHDLIQATCWALRDMGKQPDESCELTFGLFRRHLQIELSPPERRKFSEISLVASKFLGIMSDQKLAPNLWADFMSILGLERITSSTLNRIRSRAIPLSQSSNKTLSIRSTSKRDSFVGQAAEVDTISEILPNNDLNEMTFASAVEDAIRLAEMQTILDYQSLNELIGMFSKFLNEKHEQIDVTLLEFYQDYLDQFVVVLLSLTLMWLKITGEQYPDNHNLIWAQFMDLWYNWVFLNRNCQNVGKASYSLIANYFVAAIRFMINKIPNNTQAILQSTLTKLTNYTNQTKEVVYLELTILQRCMKNLPWSKLVASADDIEHLAQLSEQENYNISNLVSHIIQQIDAKHSLDRIQKSNPNLLPRVVERFVETIILQSTHLRGYRLHGRYMSVVPTEKIPHLANLILPRMESVNLEHSQNNKLLVNLLRFMCIKMGYSAGGDSSSPQRNQAEPSPSSDHGDTMLDSFNRTMIYAQFVSNYLIDLIRSHPIVIKQNGPYLLAVMDSSLQELKLLNSPNLDLSQKTALYESLLECCSCESISDQARLLLADAMTSSKLLNDKPIVVLEILHAVGQILRDAKVLVHVIETLVFKYLKMGGHYEKIWRIFRLRILPSDIYLNVCVEDRASLAMLVYFESLVAHGNPLLDSTAAATTEGNNTTDLAAAASNSSETRSQTSEQSYGVQSNTIRIWSSFLHWLAQLTLATATNVSNESSLKDAKLATAWLRMLDLLEPNLGLFLNSGGGGGDTMKPAPSSQPPAASNSDNSSRPETPTMVTEELQQQQQQQQADVSINETGQVSAKEVSPVTVVGEKQPIRRSESRLSFKANARQNAAPANLLASHRCLVDLIKQLINLYDTVNSGGLWSYLRSNSIRDERTSKLSIISLAVAYFLIDRTLAQLNGLAPSGLPGHMAALLDEVARLMKNCLGKLESARKAKIYIDYAQFIETLIESVQRNDKVQYREGLELIATFVKIVLKPPGVSSNFSSSTSNSSWTPMELVDICEQVK